ncbi:MULTISPECIES: 4-hydroxyphenylacetate 3-hydroxylase family protein [Bacillus]|uniref:4-hydroxyphenylacetate 3-hydroxylase family protein n=1 Tax=Bacillaceae TaxID=186817 RepID=UPI000596B801|nr:MULTISPECIES: 4-hydroxyphenylacetate 3-hydroxylase family protein [Bacillus]KIL74020.1 4-hydroxyphenylacetate 3-monooxygenase [Bacillus badius]RJS61836.1 4-hydroxyphenylacetate 3-hydroxylase [Bacillus sp. PK3_68]UAT32824.1 4-hydroxyphenylacetate 3-hydroxylase family protein [Bacillus badius]GLY11881.1 4-hydroxyphenylacetate 3-monooxygenase oxygenase component [Bacillus badius]
MALMTGKQYRESLNDGREIYIDGEKVTNVAEHPSFKPIIDVKARMYDMAHEAQYKDILTTTLEDGEVVSRAYKTPKTKEDLTAIRTHVETVLDDLGGVVYRVGDETIGEMWSLYDAKDKLNEIDPTYAKNIDYHIDRVAREDLFHVSANTDPKGDRSKLFSGEDGGTLLHVVEENDRGIVVKGAKFETAAAYAHQAFVKPTILDWNAGSEKMAPFACGFICDMGAPGLKHICRSSLGTNKNETDYPIATKFEEIDTLLIFDNVLIPWENVLFHRSLESAAYIRSTLHRYSAFNYTLRMLRRADYLIGVALLNVEQTGLTQLQAVKEKVSQLINYRESINAHLTAAVANAEVSPGGLMMPNQSLLYTGRVFALSNFPAMAHLTRELVGGQLAVTPDSTTMADPSVQEYIDKYYSVGEWSPEERGKLLYFARDLLNSSYAGHRTTFELFAQSPPFAQQMAVFSNFDAENQRELVRKAADLKPSIAVTNL